MSEAGSFRFTYTTLTSPAEEVHRAFEGALESVSAALGASHPLWIGGRPTSTRPEFEKRSPIDSRILVGRFQSATRDDVARAIDSAADAFPTWSAMPWQERVEVMLRAADAITERRNELAALMCLEVGKTRAEALADAEEAADLIRYYCQQIRDAEGFSRPMGQLAPNELTRDVLRPYGVWAVVSPFNFPVALAAGMSAGALIAGNTVVFKPASDAPASGLELSEILAAAGLPAGTVNVVTGAGRTVGDELVTNPRVSGLVFTGSRDVGLSIYRRFNETALRPCFLELGGKNPAIVTAHADLDKAAEGVARAAFGFAGQKCSACSRVYVERAVGPDFAAALLDATAKLAIGDPRERETFLGPLIDRRAREKFEQATAEARRDGAVLCGGTRIERPGLEHGSFVAPTVVTGLPAGHRLLTEELFLPFLCLAEVASLDEALAEANRTEYGLTAGIFSEDPGEVETFFDRIEAGVTYANRRSGATTGAWPGVNPFCGWKGSGSTGKGVCGPYYVAQFMREQSRTIMQ